jgi:radical SAM superfamily enzyme YgiQ (UPF0313 family)
MGGLSLQAVWRSLLETGEVVCDRAFSEFPDGEPLLPRVSLGRYDLIGFSLPYELDWLALPAMLHAGGLPVSAAERDENAPLVIAGGASVTMNPEPLADIVDAFVIGEAEPVIAALVRALAETRRRQDRLAALAELPGVYVPSQMLAAPVRRLIWDVAVEHLQTSVVISPHSAFPDRVLIETGRGCPMGCCFCLARSIYAPVRQASRDSILAAAAEGLRVTRKIGLIGAALSGYPNLDTLVADLVDRGADVSLSSLRADRLSPELLTALRRGGQESLTIAPEAGTEALRRSIGKAITDAQLENALCAAADSGLRDVKLYFMTNLPGETPDDREAIPALVAAWSARFPSLRFAVTLSPFVPKPWTPFEDEPFPGAREARSTVDALSARLRWVRRVTVRPGSARLGAVQAALARGDRGIGRAIVEAAAKGGAYSALKKALKSEGLDLDVTSCSPQDKPWRRAVDASQVCRLADVEGEGRR